MVIGERSGPVVIDFKGETVKEERKRLLLHCLLKDREKGSLYSRLASRALSDKLAQLSQTMSTDKTDGGPE